MQTVLLGDMSEMLRTEICRALAGKFRVRFIENGQTPRGALEREVPDKVVLDSERGGFDALPALREIRDQIKVVMLVPVEPPLLAQGRLAQQGVNEFVGKNEHRFLSRRTRPVTNLGERVLGACTDRDEHHDPQEDDPLIGPLIESAYSRANVAVGTSGLGSCHRVWREMKGILLSEHGIDWKSPQEMNPGNRYD